ncbi:cell cycle checkpoint control protein RAD9A [Thecamonas trahens ATCC 50062]|uniref:Cell cycle checkpoint control protein RAD9A n=1 Tax=Thecamonas trahens ATCC 50062 TaxID=461836 RepID=A0A0L0D126_THETB|nr:cell cycle checkpoint control protein RAD9A [Thecamonas trahens ATCC 50062]KNC45931.1 cell cycle checkpoint control protein RAD9A [Thecamonas trahens ATCC 50062]|eukprot:XP_013762914.1 cell cycle checkpoint control protein RAD9A [Thecamonas trahens ATCC 50062]
MVLLLRATLTGTLRPFARMIQCMARVGEDVSIEAHPGEFIMRTINGARSAYFSFSMRSGFFAAYEVMLRSGEPLKVKVMAKALLAVFRSSAKVSKVASCTLTITDDRVIFVLLAPSGLTKVYRISYEVSENMLAVYETTTAPNSFVLAPRLLAAAIGTFPASLQDATLELAPNKVQLASHIEASDAVGLPSGSARTSTQTHVTLDTSHFEHYMLAPDGVSITFCLKELKAMLAFAEFTGSPLRTYVHGPGLPIIFSITVANTFAADFVIATLINDDDNDPPVVPRRTTAAPPADVAVVSSSAASSGYAASGTGAVQMDIETSGAGPTLPHSPGSAGASAPQLFQASPASLGLAGLSAVSGREYAASSSQHSPSLGSHTLRPGLGVTPSRPALPRPSLVASQLHEPSPLQSSQLKRRRPQAYASASDDDAESDDGSVEATPPPPDLKRARGLGH